MYFKKLLIAIFLTVMLNDVSAQAIKVTSDQRVIFRPEGSQPMVMQVNSRIGVSSFEPLYGTGLVPSLGGWGGKYWGQIHGHNHYYFRLIKYSDRRLKKNIQKLDENECILGLEKLRPVRYKLKGQNLSRMNLTTFQSDSLHKMSEKQHMGFIAQEVNEVFPSLVSESPDGTMMMSYDELIPILVEGYQHQSKLIKKLQNELESLKSELTLDDELFEEPINGKQNWLGYNSPNPFDKETKIEVYLRKVVRRAILYFRDIEGLGEVVKTVELRKRGKFEVTVNAKEFDPGMYSYTLVVDGEVVDSKTMVLTK